MKPAAAKTAKAAPAEKVSAGPPQGTCGRAPNDEGQASGNVECAEGRAAQRFRRSVCYKRRQEALRQTQMTAPNSNAHEEQRHSAG